MKASVSPRTIKVLLCAWLASAAILAAQDVVMQTDGVRRDGLLTRVSGDQARMKIGPVEIGIPLAKIASVQKAAPAAYGQARQAWQSGDAAQTAALVKPLIDSFGGLPIAWVEQSYRLLADSYLAQHQIPQAEATYAAFEKTYPSSSQLAAIGLASVAVEKKDYSGAQARLEPIVAEAQKVLLVAADQSALYGKAYYLLGQVREAQGNNPEALQDYLTASTLFTGDQVVVAQAQQRADALSKDKQVIVP